MKRAARFFCGLALTAMMAGPAFSQGMSKTGPGLTSAQVSQALGDIGRKWDTLPKDPAHREAANQEMLRFLQQRPEVAASGVGGEGASIWIRLKDGTPVALIH